MPEASRSCATERSANGIPTTSRASLHSPDPRQEALFFSLLAELVDSGEVTSDELTAEMTANHIRHDSLLLVERYRGATVLESLA